METADHRWLKQVGASLLLASGCSAVATEVRCPIQRFRIDVAGYLDPLPKRPMRTWAAERSVDADGAASPDFTSSHPLLFRRRSRPFTCLIECKQSRADFLRDGRDLHALTERRAALHRQRREIEQTRIREREPHLRRSGTSLFPELEEWDYHLSRDGEYQKLLRELDRLDRRLHGQTKFTRAARYRLADALVLLTPPGLIAPEEAPPGWGLLEAGRDGAALRVALPIPEHEAGDRIRQRILRNIAIAASRRALALPDSPDRAADLRGSTVPTWGEPRSTLEPVQPTVD